MYFPEILLSTHRSRYFKCINKVEEDSVVSGLFRGLSKTYNEAFCEISLQLKASS